RTLHYDPARCNHGLRRHSHRPRGRHRYGHQLQDLGDRCPEGFLRLVTRDPPIDTLYETGKLPPVIDLYRGRCQFPLAVSDAPDEWPTVLRYQVEIRGMGPGQRRDIFRSPTERVAIDDPFLESPVAARRAFAPWTLD